MTTPNSHATLATTERSLAVAELARDRNGVTLNTVRTELEMAKSTAYKHLNTLEKAGYLTKEGERYYVGLRFFNLGEHARYRKPGYRLAGEVIEDVAEATGEEVDFFAESAGMAVNVCVSYTQSNPFTSEAVDESENHWRAGILYHMHSMAGGKAILSGLEESRVREIATRYGLPPNTEHTITTIDELLDELDSIRETGFALSDEEYAKGLCASAHRVDSPDGSVLGSIVVNVPKYRFESTLPEVRGHLAAAADELKDRLAEAR